jgi:hypothetical protein
MALTPFLKCLPMMTQKSAPCRHSIVSFVLRNDERAPHPLGRSTSIQAASLSFIRDAKGQALAYVCFADETIQQMSMKRLTRDEARRIAGAIGSLTGTALADGAMAALHRRYRCLAPGAGAMALTTTKSAPNMRTGTRPI